MSVRDKPPQKGVVYFLPFTQFELTVSRTLRSCPAPDKELKYDTKVVVLSTTASQTQIKNIPSI